jgi:hypothetical protein
MSIAWLYLCVLHLSPSAYNSLDNFFFFRYGDAPLIGTRIIPTEEQTFIQVAVSESFDGRTCYESALS